MDTKLVGPPRGTSRYCTSCKKPGATKACMTCKAAPVLEGDTDVAHYCSKLCQQVDWKHHKEICKNLRVRTKLFGVTALAQRLFHVYRELTWGQMDVKEVKINGRSMALKVVKNQSENGWIKLSSKLFPNPNDRLAVLNFSACREAVVWMMAFLHGFLDANIKEAKRIACDPKNSRITITADEHTTDNMLHELLKVTLESGECYAVDISGSQYGYSEAIIRWEVYASTRIQTILAENICPSPKMKVFNISDYSTEHMISQMKQINAKTDQPDLFSQFSRFLEIVNFLFVQWQNGGNFRFDRIWKLSEQERLRRQENLADFVDWRLNVMLGGTRFTAGGRLLVAKTKGIWEFEEEKELSIGIA